MKLSEAKSKIKNGLKEGYIIVFTRVMAATESVSERVPELGEELFKTEEDAWEFAEKLAKVSKGEYVRFFVMDSRLKPVGNWKSRIIDNH